MSSLRSPAAAPLEDDDLLSEILLRLPPQPSLPRASAVCKLWRSLASDLGFSRHFRAHHRRNPPFLGCFVMDSLHVHFQPTLDPPNRISQGHFSLPIAAGNRFLLLGCRHGLVLILDAPMGKQQKLVVWDPVTGDQHHLGIPPGFNTVSSWIGAAVLRAPGDIHHFQVVLVGNSAIQDTHAVASVYPSATGVWDDLISTPLPFEDSSGFPSTVYLSMPAVMVGGSFYWLLSGDSQEFLNLIWTGGAYLGYPCQWRTLVAWAMAIFGLCRQRVVALVSSSSEAFALNYGRGRPIARVLLHGCWEEVLIWTRYFL